MAKRTNTCFGPYWPSSGCLKRTGLGSYDMHCAHTWCRNLYTRAFLFTEVKLLWGCAGQVCGSVVVWGPVLRLSP